MPTFPANVDLSSLDGSTGFRLSGAAADNYSGRSVAGAGDINGDGFDDLVIGANGVAGNSGASYVVFGKAGGFAADLSLDALDGSNGFRLSGAATGDVVGVAVAGAGDVNGDGFADLLIGAPGVSGSTGASYVIFGRAGGFASDFSLAALSASDGFQLIGAASGDASGYAVAGAGDLNGDGFADLVIGSKFADTPGFDSGASYVVFGKASGFGSALSLSFAADGSSGFRLNGGAAFDNAGLAVSGAGDVNGDGYADVIVGAFRADGELTDSGASYVVFGKASGFASDINLAALDGENGFRLNGGSSGGRSGVSVSAAGDVNADGYGDVIVGAYFEGPDANYAGASYVVFGTASGFAADFALDGVDGLNGFRLSGAMSGDQSGRGVAGAGDVNGDGFDDLIVGSYNALGAAGASYVVFGKASGFSSDLNLSTLDGSNGFQLTGVASGDYSGLAVSGAGDLNGDGFADVVVGALGADSGALSNAGASYVVFGRAPAAAVYRVGTEAAQTLAGGAFADTLEGLGGADWLYGNDGDDTLDGGTGADTMTGGSGSDSYLVDNAGDVIRETAGQGQQDSVLVALASYTLAAFVENGIVTRSEGGALTGNALDNSLLGADGSDTLSGGMGEDFLDGSTQGDTLIGGDGSDTYVVDSVNDRVIETNNNRQFGGSDTVQTALASYRLGANVENGILLFAGTLTGNALDNFLAGGTGGDILNGGNGDDTLLGGDGADQLRGGSGSDYLDAGAGVDRMAGGDGGDIYFVDDSRDVVSESPASQATGGRDLVYSYATFRLGTAVEDLYLLGTADLTATGNGLANVIGGNNGANVLRGLGGADTLTGGAGADRFVFNTALGSTQADLVTDFVSGVDKLVLDDDIFTRLGVGSAAGLAINSAFFRVGAAAQDANDYLVYNPASGLLSYDSDGSGSTPSIPIATLSLNGNPSAPLAADFLLVI